MKSKFILFIYKHLFLKVVDKDGNNIDYFNLSKSDKEIVLTELLLQTALQSIAEKRIVSILFFINIHANILGSSQNSC
jgi:hypothetical protein